MTRKQQQTGRSWVVVYGEPFYVEREPGRLRLRHPQWSLLGVGPTLDAARRSLYREVKDLASWMQDMDVRRMSHEAQRMRAFVLNRNADPDPDCHLKSPHRPEAAQ